METEMAQQKSSVPRETPPYHLPIPEKRGIELEPVCWAHLFRARGRVGPKCRLLLKAGCAPCLAGCRWDEICTKWVENLLFEVILMAFSSVSRPETWRTQFLHQKTLSGGQKRRFLNKLCYLKKYVFRFLAEIRLRTLIKSHQKASSRPKTCKFRTTCTLP